MDVYTLLDALAAGLRSDERVLFCSFPGDPTLPDDTGKRWRARVYSDRVRLYSEMNTYGCVMAAIPNKRGEYRRRIDDNFAGGLLLMIDDLGTGPGSKAPLSLIDRLPPSALIETSPNNHQALYIFPEPERNRRKFEALILAFIAEKFLSAGDPGMSGANRVFRLPDGTNGKAAYNGFKTRAVEMNLDRRYKIDEIANAFSLELTMPGSALRAPASLPKERTDMFIETLHLVESLGLKIKENPDMAGWIPIHCPWSNEHSGFADTGAAIRTPHVENEYYGAFRCHHGHCATRGWREFTEHITDVVAERLCSITTEKEFENYKDW